MKVSKVLLLPIFISILLFIIPFFWLKPGEMDLGGDSNRLYFYDPLSYLVHHSFYNIVPTGVGGEAISYYAIPYISLLVLLRFLMSATTLISLINGAKLAFGFFFCYLIIKELLNVKPVEHKQNIVEISSIFSALFYTLSPILVNSGWEKAIFSHMQLFFNPLFFFLILKTFLTKSRRYLYLFLLLSFIFSMAFSYPAAPPFFAFYPFSLIYIMLYTKFIRHSNIPVKLLIEGFALFFFIQSFHLIPHLIGIFSFGSDVSASVFSDQSKLVRGLDYFTAIAPSIKVSFGLFSLPQRIDENWYSYLFFVFPVIILLGYYYNKSKVLLLTGSFFLIYLFFACANITNTGFFIYKLLFYIPGFKMFRNFYGQWAFSYVFFYCLLFSQAFVNVLSKISFKRSILLTIAIILPLVFSSWKLLNGSIVNSLHYQSKNIKSVVQMDPEYEKVLHYIHNSSVDGKILTFPLSGPGYQVVSGKDEKGAYVGPPTFSYLEGKNDFTGYEGLSPFNELFVRAVVDKKDDFYQRLFSILNIQYVFYNSDPKIYDDNFPSYPYDYPRQFMPATQEGYKEFIKKLPLDFENRIDFNNKYHLYPVQNNLFLPHIYTSNFLVYTTKPLEFQFNTKFNQYPSRTLFTDVYNYRDSEDDVLLEAEENSWVAGINNNVHLHTHKPFISVPLDSFRYPFALFKENLSLWRRKNSHDDYVDLSLFYMSKRIEEIDVYGEEMPLGDIEWKKPHLWEVNKFQEYKSWYASILRYKDEVENLIFWINNQEANLGVDKVKISEQLHHHQLILINILRHNHKSYQDKEKLVDLVNTTFDSLFTDLKIGYYDTSLFTYNIIKPDNIVSGEFEIYVDNMDNSIHDIDKTYIQIDNQILKPLNTGKEGSIIRFENATLSSNDKIELNLHSPQSSIINNTNWKNSAEIDNKDNEMHFLINNLSLDSSGGVIKEISGWKPNKQYVITFDYMTSGDNFLFKLFDNQENLEKSGNLIGQTYFEKNLNSREWETSQSVVTSNQKSLKAFIQFLVNSDKKDAHIELKNISIVEINYPNIILKKVSTRNKKTSTLPIITFTKKNLTKYEINVVGVTEPYILAFSEAYSKHWKLFLPSDRDTDFWGSINTLAGNFGRSIVSLFDKSNSSDEIIKSYFNGTIREGHHVDKFLEKATFDSWGKKSIPDENHIRINGFANAWYLTPEDTNNSSSYTLILEMDSQRYFYYFFTLSLVVFVGVLIGFGLTYVKKHNKNK